MNMFTCTYVMSAVECMDPISGRLKTRRLAAELSPSAFQHDQLKRAQSPTSPSNWFLSFNIIAVRKERNFSLTNGLLNYRQT